MLASQPTGYQIFAWPRDVNLADDAAAAAAEQTACVQPAALCCLGLLQRHSLLPAPPAQHHLHSTSLATERIARHRERRTDKESRILS